MPPVSIDTVLHLQDLGLERLDEDKAIIDFARIAEPRLARRLDFAKGALLFVMVPGDNDSGTFYNLRAGPVVLLSALTPDRAA